jgi:hypothetical protein
MDAKNEKSSFSGMFWAILMFLKDVKRCYYLSLLCA